MLSPAIARALAQQRSAELLEDAARYRLRRCRRQASRRRVRGAVGGLLVRVGARVAGTNRRDEAGARLWPYPL
jgi:hypothetical protein